MSIFIDTGIFTAFHNTQDANHSKAVTLIRRIAEGELGTAYTSDYIFDETVTLTLTRTRRPDLALNIGRMILGRSTAPFLTILRVNEEAFTEAWKLFSRYAEKRLSFTDCTSIALMRMKDMETILSFDSGFDGIIPRTS